jgi:hypothetical protein
MNKVSRKIKHFYHTDSFAVSKQPQVHSATAHLSRCNQLLSYNDATALASWFGFAYGTVPSAWMPGWFSWLTVTRWLFGYLRLNGWLADCRIPCCLVDSMVQGWSSTTDSSPGQGMLCFCGLKGSAQCSQQPATEHYSAFQSYTHTHTHTQILRWLPYAKQRVRTSHLPHISVSIQRRF